MAIFDDLPVELQESIWELVFPRYGGIHWIDVEGNPHSTKAIRETLVRVHRHFNDNERTCLSFCGCDSGNPKEHEIYENYVWAKSCRGDFSTPYFELLYPIVPSVWGRAGSSESDIDQDCSNLGQSASEVIDTRRCRQLSTYTQITSLLSTCISSRRCAVRWLESDILDQRGYLGRGRWSLGRGEGLNNRPRPLGVWKEQYETPGIAPPKRQKPEAILPTVRIISDLVVFRLHTAFGNPTTTLKHNVFQLQTERIYNQPPMISEFKRVGIEWNPLWATEGGQDAFNINAMKGIHHLPNRCGPEQFYWLVEGAPRPQWEDYPSCIPAAYSFLIDRLDLTDFETERVTEVTPGEMLRDSFPSSFPKQHDLYHDLEANGRRYYIVFMFTHECRFDYLYKYLSVVDDGGVFLGDTFPSPDVCWSDLFPGGKDLWPKALHDPVEFAAQTGIGMIRGRRHTLFLSWESI
jgi:hypothetical protein